MHNEFKMFHSATTTAPRRQRCCRSKKRSKKFFGVSSHEKGKRAQQLFESRKEERQLSKVGAKSTSTVVGGEGRPSTSPEVEVAPSSTPGSAMRSGEMEPSRTEPPALLYPFCRSTVETFALWGGATLQGSETASGWNLSLSDAFWSVSGEICMPNIDRINVWEELYVHSDDVHDAAGLISLCRQYHSIGWACAWTGAIVACWLFNESTSMW